MADKDIWERLTLEGNHDLIAKLHYVEQGEAGFGTIVVPVEGFSEDDDTHNAVLDWLREHNVNILNPGREITILTKALKEQYDG